jgi:hypothetical protein
LNLSCLKNSSHPETLDKIELLTVGEPTAIAFDLKTSVMISFLSALAILNTFTTVSGLCR